MLGDAKTRTHDNGRAAERSRLAYSPRWRGQLASGHVERPNRSAGPGCSSYGVPAVIGFPSGSAEPGPDPIRSDPNPAGPDPIRRPCVFLASVATGQKRPVSANPRGNRRRPPAGPGKPVGAVENHGNPVENHVTAPSKTRAERRRRLAPGAAENHRNPVENPTGPIRSAQSKAKRTGATAHDNGLMLETHATNRYCAPSIGQLCPAMKGNRTQ